MMEAIVQSDLRIISKILQNLKQNYGIQIGYQDPSLGMKVFQEVQRTEEPILVSLWASLSEQFRAAALDQLTRLHEKRDAKQLYRGSSQSKATQEPTAKYTERTYRGVLIQPEEHTQKTDLPLSEDRIDGVNGKYITYRGSKKWVAKSD